MLQTFVFKYHLRPMGRLCGPLMRVMYDVTGTSLRNVGTRAAVDMTGRGHLLGQFRNSRWRVVSNSGAIIIIISRVSPRQFRTGSRYKSPISLGWRAAFKLHCFLPIGTTSDSRWSNETQLRQDRACNTCMDVVKSNSLLIVPPVLLARLLFLSLLFGFAATGTFL
jgi:hypothetical protein